MQVPNIKAVICPTQTLLEIAWKQRRPGIVSKMDNPPSGISQPHQQIVLLDRRAREARPDIYKRGQRPGRQALQALQRRRRRIRNEGEQERVVRLAHCHLMQERQRIVECRRGSAIERHRKIVPQRIDDDHDSLLERARVPAPGVVRAGSEAVCPPAERRDWRFPALGLFL
jgi:hypothetical protein